MLVEVVGSHDIGGDGNGLNNKKMAPCKEALLMQTMIGNSRKIFFHSFHCRRVVIGSFQASNPPRLIAAKCHVQIQKARLCVQICSQNQTPLPKS